MERRRTAPYEPANDYLVSELESATSQLRDVVYNLGEELDRNRLVQDELQASSHTAFDSIRLECQENTGRLCGCLFFSCLPSFISVANFGRLELGLGLG
ncbi:hypothetical protein P9112_012850 [Eukaryota sp. TZLM1-RC]